MIRTGLFISVVISALLLVPGCDDDPPLGTAPDVDDPDEYFGLIPGRTIDGYYNDYVADSGRAFHPDGADDWSFSATIGQLTDFNEKPAYPVSVTATPLGTGAQTPYSYTLYLKASSEGLYFLGGSYCGVDIPLDTSAWLAPYPLDTTQTFETTGDIVTRVNQCLDTPDLDSVTVTSLFHGNVDVRGHFYRDASLLRVPVPDLPGGAGMRFFELWISPGSGPVRGVAFTDNTYLNPIAGFEYSSISD